MLLTGAKEPLSIAAVTEWKNDHGEELVRQGARRELHVEGWRPEKDQQQDVTWESTGKT